MTACVKEVNVCGAADLQLTSRSFCAVDKACAVSSWRASVGRAHSA